MEHITRRRWLAVLLVVRQGSVLASFPLLHHICYYSDLRKMQAHYPGWNITCSLQDVSCETVVSWQVRLVDHLHQTA